MEVGIELVFCKPFDLEKQTRRTLYSHKEMDLETAQTNATAKFPILKQGEYEMWRLRIEQYFQVQDYALWDVIENGNSFKPTTRTTANADGTSTSMIPGPVTTEEKAQKKNDVKARSMLLMALPNEHQLTFNQYKDAKTLFDAIQTRFGGNDATRKTQKTLLKQMYENFNALSTESLDSIFNRLQKIVSQLAILGENISQEDLNLKFLRSLPSEWNTHVVVWRNKSDLDTMSIDDLYNNFKIVEQEVKRTVTSSSNSNSSSQNMAFVSSPSSTNEVNTANVQVSTANSPVSTADSPDSTANLSDATVYAFLANQPNGSQLVHEDLEQIHEDDLEEMDLKWQLALLSMRARRYFQRTGKKITINGSDTAGYDKSKVECFNCHKMGHFARECRGPRNQDNRNRNQDSSRRTVNVEETSSKAMVAIDGAVEFNKSEFNLATYKIGLASVEEQLVFYKKMRSGLEEFQQPEFEGYGPKASKSVCKDTFNEVKKTPDAPLGEKLVSKKEKQTVFPTKIESVKQQEKPARKPVNFDHVQAHYNYHQREGMVNGNNYTRVNYNYSAKKAHPNSHRNITPRAVFMKTGLKPLNTARPVNTAHPKTIVYRARPISCFSKLAQSTVKRPYQSRTSLTNKNFNQKINTAKEKVYTAKPKAVNIAKPKAVNTARPTSAVVNDVRANQIPPQKEDQGYVDSGCSRHMTGNMSYLTDFKELDGRTCNIKQKCVGDEAVHKELGDRMERAATTASSLEAEQDSGSGPRVNTLGSGEDSTKLMELMAHSELANVSTATIDGRVKTVTEASIRRHLKLENSDGISTLPNTEFFEQLALMGNMKRASKGYTGVDTPLFQTMLVQGQTLQGEGSTIPVESHHTPTSAPSTSQPPTSSPSMPTTHVAEEAAPMPHDLPLPRVHSLGSDEGSLTLNELTVLCTSLSKKVESLESNLKQTKQTYDAAYTKLIMKVKKLEHKVKSIKVRRKVRLVISDDEVDLEDPSKQGRKIAQIDKDEGITLV
ncbi:putative ribonuclease H-like domain-containing protein [Tanacetum coccineum]